ncbi:MAG: hypothetical protein A2583_05680 [Bdellovibrionales bacterium RIFOXYD1_FULL_53_11]|nr:MAG: hypothetical protein A2583_05680 [Bdellovibrionales bacterium RIFOXYD1_FULL_53_11]
MKIRKKLNYGKKDLLSLAPIIHRDVKVMISIKLDGDVLLAAKEKAAKDGLPYQTWINRLLRQNVLTEGDSIEARLAKAEARVEKIEQMIREIQSGKAA